MIVYSQSKGSLAHVVGEQNPTVLGRGYAGHPPYVNQSECQTVKAGGPLPRGRYRVCPPFDHVRLGPLSFFLEPDPKNEMYGRSGFFIHGDNSYGNRSASHGCIVMARAVRLEIATLVATTKGGLFLDVIE